MVEIIVVVVVIAVLCLALFPSYINARDRAQRINCTSRLKQIGLGFRLWSGYHGEKYPQQLLVSSNGVMELIERGDVASAFLVMSNELSTPKILWCPSDRRNRMASTFTNGIANSNVNYFVALDADETRPQMFLAGDDNFLINAQPVTPGVIALATNSPVAWSTARHNQQGNVGLADGSVQGFSTTPLRTALQNTGTKITRLAFP